MSKRRKGRRQVIHAGSYAMVESRPLLETLGSFTVQAMIWPTTPGKGEQGIVTKWDPRSRTGFALVIDDAGSVALRLGKADGTVETVSVGKPLLERHWYLAAASYDSESGRVTIHQEPLLPYARANDGGTAKRTLGPAAANTNAPIVMAGIFKRRQKGRVLVDGLYNGKIDSPRLVGRALDRLEMERMKNEAVPASIAPDILCAWDFSRDITSIKISDRSPHHFDGEIVNLPARGMTGWNFSGEEMCWRHARQNMGPFTSTTTIFTTRAGMWTSNGPCRHAWRAGSMRRGSGPRAPRNTCPSWCCPHRARRRGSPSCCRRSSTWPMPTSIWPSTARSASSSPGRSRR